MVKENIRNLIQNGLTLEALDALINFLGPKNTELLNHAILCKARYIDYRTNLIKNTIVNNTVTLSQINNSVLSILDLFDVYSIIENIDTNEYLNTNLVPNSSAMPNPEKPIRVFLSYAHADSDLQKNLDIHLSTLKNTKMISLWSDVEILPGLEWDSTIKEELEKAELILLLISANFNASKYIWNYELSRAIEKHNNQQSTVIPIFGKPCDFSGMPYAKLQGTPKNAQPISTFKNTDEALTEVVKAIRTIVEKIITLKQSKET